MQIRSFGISRAADETLSDFMLKLQSEVRKIEDAKQEVLDIVLELPDSHGNTFTTASVFYRGDGKEDFSMRMEEFTGKTDSALAALDSASTQFQAWLGGQSQNSPMIHDLKSTFNIDDEGNDVVVMRVFYNYESDKD